MLSSLITTLAHGSLELNYDVAYANITSVTIQVSPPPLHPSTRSLVFGAVALNAHHGIVTSLPATSPFEKEQKEMFCNDPTVNNGANHVMQYPFFEEEVCFNEPLSGAPPNTTQAACFGHQVGEYMDTPGSVQLANATAAGTREYDGKTYSVYSFSLYKESVATVSLNRSGTISTWYLLQKTNETIEWLVDESKHNTLRLRLAIAVQDNECLPNSTAICPGGKPACTCCAEHPMGVTHVNTTTEFTGAVVPPPPSIFVIPKACVKLDDAPSFASSALTSWSTHSRILRGGVVSAFDEVLAGSKPINDPVLIAAVNAQRDDGSIHWSAGESTFMRDASYAEFASFALGTHLANHLVLPPSPHAETLRAKPDSIPTHFDAREKWPKCKSIGTIRNQGHCGSCWAFGAIEVLADRICIASDGAKQPDLSPESLVDCDTHDAGCQGGFLDNAWRFLRDVGALEESCYPYQHCDYTPFPNCTKGKKGSRSVNDAARSVKGKCPTTKCTDGTTALTHHRASNAYAVAKPGDVESIQRELIAHGPVEVGFQVFSDFHLYQTGVYSKSKTATGPEGGHAVKIIGWGVENGVDYWLVANSWSPGWGDLGGFFKIKRGDNECAIETTPAAGLPKL